MVKMWSVLFAIMTLASLGLFIISPAMGWWLPKQASTHAHNIDDLFYIILYITGFFFILTETLLFVFMWKYAVEPGQKRVPAPVAQAHTPPQGGLFAKVKDLIHDEHRLEMLWTIVPAVILLYIAFAQVGAWAEVKYQARMPQAGRDGLKANQSPLHLAVTARQWEWRVRYPSLKTLDHWNTKPADGDVWGRKAQFDDVHVVNEIHTWVGQPTVVHLRTNDIIHSFFLPQMRVKQDALPGKIIPVWFTVKPDMYNCKPHLVYIKSNTTPPDSKQPWVLYDNKETKDGYAWVSHWKDGYDADPKNEAGQQFKDKSQIWELNCAELCGAFHYRMIGRVYVHENEADFRRWLELAEKHQNDHGTPAAPGGPAHK